MYHVLERFVLISELTKQFEDEFSVLRRLAGCSFPRANQEVCILNPSLVLCNIPVVSYSSAEFTTFRIVLHVIRIGPLQLGVGLLGLSRKNLLR